MNPSWSVNFRYVADCSGRVPVSFLDRYERRGVSRVRSVSLANTSGGFHRFTRSFRIIINDRKRIRLVLYEPRHPSQDLIHLHQLNAQGALNVSYLVSFDGRVGLRSLHQWGRGFSPPVRIHRYGRSCSLAAVSTASQWGEVPTTYQHVLAVQLDFPYFSVSLESKFRFLPPLSLVKMYKCTASWFP